MRYLENRLNEFDTYTYNLALYMVNRQDFSQLEQANKILIADNARRAQFNIIDLEQIFVIGHNAVREALGNKFSMKIAEPIGTALLPTIIVSAGQLQIENHEQAGYIIEISFNGRLPNGAAKKHDQVFYYPVTITEFNFKVEEGGTNYNINFVENSTNAYNHSANTIKSAITIEAQTFGEFIRELQVKYNQAVINAWAANINHGMFHDTYEIELDESAADWADWRFQVLDEGTYVTGVNIIGNPGENATLQFVITAGSNLTSIISSALQAMVEYKNILLTQRNSNSQNSARPEPSQESDFTYDQLPTFFKVITNVEYEEYDYLANKYQRTIKYKIKPFIVSDESIDITAYQNSITNQPVQNARVRHLNERQLLRKRYDYYYTGTNTEVLNFDMQFNHAYYYMSPFGAGFFGDSDLLAPVIAGDTSQVISRLKQAEAELRSSRLALADAAQRRTNAYNSLRTAQSADDAIEANLAIQDANDAFNARLAENTSTTSNFLNIIKEDYNLSVDSVNYFLRFEPDNITDQDTATTDNDIASGNHKMGAVKSNLENAADLVKIELEIKGDPYWMGQPNSFYTNSKDIDGVADYEAGLQSFFLHANLPTSIEDSSGRRKPSPDYQITGVYTVRNVINRFSNGTFVQYLSAVRDLNTNIPTAYVTLASDSDPDESVGDATLSRERDIAQAAETAYRGLGEQRLLT